SLLLPYPTLFRSGSASASWKRLPTISRWSGTWSGSTDADAHHTHGPVHLRVVPCRLPRGSGGRDCRRPAAPGSAGRVRAAVRDPSGRAAARAAAAVLGVRVRLGGGAGLRLAAVAPARGGAAGARGAQAVAA